MDNEDGEDITKEFLEACRQLKLGEIVKHENFKLVDSMSATELLDPKMDSGMFPIKESLSLSDLIKDGEIDIDNVPLSQFIATIDGTLAMIVSWLHGQPLDQTVYTNICLMELEAISNPILLGISSSLLALANNIKVYVELSSVFDEEDFLPFSCREVSVPDNYVDKLGDAIDIVKSRKMNKAELKKLDALERRLCFLQSLFEMFSYLLPPASDTSGNVFIPNLKKSGVLSGKTLRHLKDVIDSIDMGGKSPDGQDANFSWIPFFRPHLNRQFSSASFVRDPKLVSRVEALKYFEKLLYTISQMVNSLPERMRTLEGLLEFFETFGGFDSCVLSRSIAQLLVMPNDYSIGGMTSLLDIIYDSVNRLDLSLNGNNPKLLSDDFGSSKGEQNVEMLGEFRMRLSEFMTFCARTFVSIFQLYGRNVARQRDLLVTCFEELHALQTESADLERLRWGIGDDEKMNRSSVLSSFLIYYILYLMYYHFRLGFQLELFVPYEFSYIYWYFGDVVLKNFANLLERRCNLQVLYYGKYVASLDKKKPNKRQQMKQKAEAELRRQVALMKERITFCKLESLLAYATVKFCVGLTFSQRLQVPDGERLRYQQRIGVYYMLPPLLYVPYESYAAVKQRLLSLEVKQCFAEATEHFEEALNHIKSFGPLEELPAQMQCLMRNIQKNLVVTKLFASSPDLKKNVSFQYSVADGSMFPVIKLS